MYVHLCVRASHLSADAGLRTQSLHFNARFTYEASSLGTSSCITGSFKSYNVKHFKLVHLKDVSFPAGLNLNNWFKLGKGLNWIPTFVRVHIVLFITGRNNHDLILQKQRVSGEL